MSCTPGVHKIDRRILLTFIRDPDGVFEVRCSPITDSGIELFSDGAFKRERGCLTFQKGK